MSSDEEGGSVVARANSKTTTFFRKKRIAHDSDSDSDLPSVTSPSKIARVASPVADQPAEEPSGKGSEKENENNHENLGNKPAEPAESERIPEEQQALPSFDSDEETTAVKETAAAEPTLPLPRSSSLVSEKKVQLDILRDEPQLVEKKKAKAAADRDYAGESDGDDDNEDRRLLKKRIKRLEAEKARKKPKKLSEKTLEKQRLELQRESERLIRESKASLTPKPVVKKNLADLLGVLKSKTDVPKAPVPPPIPTPPPSSLSTVPVPLVSPVLGQIDAEDILEKDPEHLTVILPKQAKAPPPKIPFAFKKTTTRKELMEQMTLQCLEHRAKQRKESESQLEDPASAQAETDQPEQDEELDPEAEDGSEREGEEEEENREGEEDEEDADADEEDAGSEKGSDDENNDEGEKDNQETTQPTQIVSSQPTEGTNWEALFHQNVSDAKKLLELEREKERERKSNMFVDGEAEESDVEQGFGLSGDEEEGLETLKDQHMVVADDEDLGGVDVNHGLLFQKQEAETDEKLIKAIVRKEFRRGKGRSLDDFDEQFELVRRRKKKADEDLGLKPGDDRQRPDLDISESSDVEDSLIESMHKRTVIREIEHRQMSDNSQSFILEESNVTISTQSSLSSLLKASSSCPLPMARDPSNDAQVGRTLSAVLASVNPVGLKKQTFLLGRTDSTERLNRLGALLTGEEKGNNSARKGRFVFDVGIKKKN